MNNFQGINSRGEPHYFFSYHQHNTSRPLTQQCHTAIIVQLNTLLFIDMETAVICGNLMQWQYSKAVLIIAASHQPYWAIGQLKELKWEVGQHGWMVRALPLNFSFLLTFLLFSSLTLFLLLPCFPLSCSFFCPDNIRYVSPKQGMVSDIMSLSSLLCCQDFYKWFLLAENKQTRVNLHERTKIGHYVTIILL